jgi:hypothetical protein
VQSSPNRSSSSHEPREISPIWMLPSCVSTALANAPPHWVP